MEQQLRWAYSETGSNASISPMLCLVSEEGALYPEYPNDVSKQLVCFAKIRKQFLLSL